MRNAFALGAFGTVIALSVAAGLAQTPAPSQAPAPAAAAQSAPAPAPLPPALTSCPELATAVRTVAANDARMRDWANLARYREANHSVGATEVVFMGDSITDAWVQPRYGQFFPGKKYTGRGISGQTTPQMLLRFRQDVINLKPKVVVILAGTNDIAGNTGPTTDEEIQGNLTSMSELAANAGIKVVFTSITPTSAYHLANPNAAPQTSTRPLARIRAINDWMKAYAASHKQVYVDYYSAMIDDKGMLKSELSGDDLHPTAAGYAIMAPLAQAGIDKALR
ncbi:MAG: GDSL-type esterase/lipase family protein [Vicinamibacterales bacterium]